MGYEVYITRKDNWFDEGLGISLAEWLEVVRTDPEMRLEGYAEASVGGGAVLSVEDPSLSVWIAYSRNNLNGNMAWLWHAGGNVRANNPDSEILRKMYCLANQLSAKVQGDEGEIYGADGEPVVEEALAHAQSTKKSWWRLW